MFFFVEFGVSLHGDNKLEFLSRHVLQLPFKPVSIATKQLHNFQILDTVEKLDSLRIIHHAGNGPVESLSLTRCPNASLKGEFRCGALETDEVEQ